jgi:hypothetical protein
MARFDQPIELMTLGNMRELGVRSLDVSCWNCRRRAGLSVVAGLMTSRCRRLARGWCTGCGIVGADARPNCQERPPRETLTGVQWRTT